ncbi:hypothetical protein G7Y89_g1892 [Cudoniella acicularis]|uniref:AAA+ ATPase domain-containing protein n=1 Tax=Cudoniella acicularis TaxID=354080 RepID=A0A8H4RUE0_9HELO|nr:hypothetical protein G7Y89_g1892 [Cudoniella acicularis]
MEATRSYNGHYRQFAFLWRPAFGQRQKRLYRNENRKYVEQGHDLNNPEGNQTMAHQSSGSHIATSEMIQRFINNRCSGDIDRHLHRKTQISSFLGANDNLDINILRSTQTFIVLEPKALLEDRNNEYVTDLDRFYGLAIVFTVSSFQAAFIRDFLHRYLSLRSLIGVDIWNSTCHAMLGAVRHSWWWTPESEKMMYSFTREDTDVRNMGDLLMTQEKGFKWTIRVLRQFNYLLSKTIDAWDNFNNGEIRYFYKPHSDELADPAWIPYLAAIDKDVTELRDLRNTLQYQTELFENMTNSLITHAQHAETIIARLQTSTIFSMQTIIPNSATIKHWVYLLASLFVATIILVFNLVRLKAVWEILRISNERFWGWVYRVVFEKSSRRREVGAENEDNDDEIELEELDDDEIRTSHESGELSMRLINTSNLEIHEFFGDKIPHYAILSHRWETEEVTFQDLQEGKGAQMRGWDKISGCCARAALDGWLYVVNKTSSAELSEAINSMFEWYRAADTCYAYLSDVLTAQENPLDEHSDFRQSKWFSRGWTLQELLAPREVRFFDRDWKEIGTKSGLKDLIQSITGITHLFDYREASVAQQLSWASARETTRLEDQAYCLLGLFNVNMPLLYGEGSAAFQRLQLEILGKTDDDSIFAWEGPGEGGLLASSPKLFRGAHDVVVMKLDPERPPVTITSKGVGLEFLLMFPDRLEWIHGAEKKKRVAAPMNCKRLSPMAVGSEPDLHVGLVLYREAENAIWRRENRLLPVAATNLDFSQSKRTLVYVPQSPLEAENRDLPTEKRFRQPLLRTIDWRRQLCQFLNLGFESTDEALIEALESASEKLEELERLTAVEDDPRDLVPRYQVIHRVRCANDRQVQRYVKEPFAVKSGQQGYHLRSTESILDFDLYLERNKAISFVVYKDYRCCDPQPQLRRPHKTWVPEASTMLIVEGVFMVSPVLCSALKNLADEILFNLPHPNFSDVGTEFQAPYLWWFCTRDEIAEALKSLQGDQKHHASVFAQYLRDHFETTWSTVDYLLSSGWISAEYIDYLYAPNTILVKRSDNERFGQQQAYLAKSYLSTEGRNKSQHPESARPADFAGFIEGESWTFNGTFQNVVEHLPIGSLPSMTEEFKITDLNLYPIKYAEPGLESTLKERGEKFWTYRSKMYVSYSDEEDDDSYEIQSNMSSRFMIDSATYKAMHPSHSTDQIKERDDLGPKKMEEDYPPLKESFILCLPGTIPGFDMNKKLWTTLDVTRIKPIVWDDGIFQSLVIDRRAKELIAALITNRIDAEKGADVVAGKGNGLVFLLHGAPGTGKSLTAESVAEYARKPLYRFTSGELGTDAVEAEKVIKNVYHMVLLDEADDLLEQRRVFDMKRNSIISSILIMTSNRVGTFDEALRSRINLTLSYPPLDKSLRLKIWEIFILRLDRTGSHTKSKEIRERLPQLAEATMNGRQIRNTISTARQLAMYRREPMGYDHLNAVIEETGKFETYLEESRGFTFEEAARMDSFRKDD